MVLKDCLVVMAQTSKIDKYKHMEFTLLSSLISNYDPPQSSSKCVSESSDVLVPKEKRVEEQETPTTNKDEEEDMPGLAASARLSNHSHF